MEQYQENSRRTQRVADVQTVLAHLCLPTVERPDTAQIANTAKPEALPDLWRLYE